MVFVYAKTYKDVKGKIYLHKSGEGFYQENLKKYIWAALGTAPKKVNRLDYFNSILWAENGKRIIDFFGYYGTKGDWNANPEIHSWVIYKGIWTRENPITCGEGIILLGEEEKLRRRTKNIEEYLSHTILKLL